MLPATLFGAAAQAAADLEVAEGPDGPPTNASVYPYGGGLYGVQWTPGDPLASTHFGLNGGANPNTGGLITPFPPAAPAGATSHETGSDVPFAWWLRHARNGQFSDWVQALFQGSGGGEGGEQSNPTIDSVTQTTDPDSCSVGSPVNIRIQITSAGPSLMTLQRSVNGGAFATVDAAVPAGATTLNRSETSGNSYRYQIKYNDVSPEQYSAVSASTSAVCNLI